MRTMSFYKLVKLWMSSQCYPGHPEPVTPPVNNHAGSSTVFSWETLFTLTAWQFHLDQYIACSLSFILIIYFDLTVFPFEHVCFFSQVLIDKTACSALIFRSVLNVRKEVYHLFHAVCFLSRDNPCHELYQIRLKTTFIIPPERQNRPQERRSLLEPTRNTTLFSMFSHLSLSRSLSKWHLSTTIISHFCSNVRLLSIFHSFKILFNDTKVRVPETLKYDIAWYFNLDFISQYRIFYPRSSHYTAF